MKKIPSNAECFKISQENQELHLDSDYFLINKHPEIDYYIKNIKEIKEVLITIKKMKENKESRKVLEKYYEKLFDLFNTKFSNCSELGCFVNACDSTRDMVQKDYRAFKFITDTFIKRRIIDEMVPENWVQAILDSNSSRRKGVLGENKLIKILKKFGFLEIKNLKDLNIKNKCVIRFSNEIVTINSVRDYFGVKIPLKK